MMEHEDGEQTEQMIHGSLVCLAEMTLLEHCSDDLHLEHGSQVYGELGAELEQEADDVGHEQDVDDDVALERVAEI